MESPTYECTDFTPNNQYYQLRNASTGYYMTYSNGIKTVRHTTPTSADDFHLMRGRVDVDGHRGYYIIHPESTATPQCLNATTNGNTATAQWDIAKSATTQRWLILTAEEAENFENGNLGLALERLNKMMAQIRKLAKTPHSEDVDNADATLNAALLNIENQAESCTKEEEVNTLVEQTCQAAVTFLSSVSVTDISKPFDLTFMLENPDFDNDVTTGWTSTNGAPGYDAQGAEFYEKTFNFYQVLENMPSGTYELRTNAFQRPGASESVLTPYKNGTAKVTTSLYINSTTASVKHICDDRQSTAVFNDGGWDSDIRLSDGTYIPNCMVGAEKYFDKGLYDNGVNTQINKSGSKLRVGIKCTSAPTYSWSMFDSFRLYFFGGNDTLVGIEMLQTSDTTETSLQDQPIYDLTGRKVKGILAPGIYLIGEKKVLMK